MKKTFTDSRGSIRDLLVTDEYSITRITFTKDAVRGNHVHNQTTQHDFVLGGELTVSLNGKEHAIKRGAMISIPKDMPHAYKAIEPSEIISICFGVRKGKDYEKDTIRLDKPLL